MKIAPNRTRRKICSFGRLRGISKQIYLSFYCSLQGADVLSTTENIFKILEIFLKIIYKITIL